ncbi:hypothetical protein SAMN04488057_10592 [Cyclobacterium lianum]|uniref:Uncharacterized protein n=1 Tax=Cyclobacterium lianum TaxID=388280 RepID=A0A1M7N7W6_9BACT|nr:hypothetical protein [Cyclobacterium lianum]SHM99148.1 hypothetical protein SAMN04488057_10592 [Cyclobacterium lianum]
MPYSLKGMGGRLLLISLLFTLVFCQRKKASERASAEVQISNLFENFTFSMDTLMVDTGDQLIGETNTEGLSALPKGGFSRMASCGSMLMWRMNWGLP